MKGRFHLTRAGGGAIVIAILMLAAGLMKTINLLILLGDLLLVLIVINSVMAWRVTRALRVVRALPVDHVVGMPSARALEIANDSPRTCIIDIREESVVHTESCSGTIDSGEVMFTRLPFTPTRRGTFPVRTILTSGYPFGFVRHSVSGVARDPLIVYPALGRLDLDRFRRWLRLAGAGDARTRRPTQQFLSAHADLRGVRPYRSSDSPRHIHWRTSARRCELMVREYDSPDALDLVIVLEAWLPTVSTKPDLARLESAISLTATILQAWCHDEQSPRVMLVVPGRDDVIDGRASAGLARSCFAALSVLDGRAQWGYESLPQSQARSIRLLVSSRDESGPLPEFLQSRTGQPWQRLTPMDAPAWYHPPTQARRDSSATRRSPNE